MKLYMKQKVFSWKDRFTVKNEELADVFCVEGKFFSLGKQLHIYDMAGNELAFVKQKLLTLMPRFFVERDGRTICEIAKKLTFLKPRYVVEGLGLEVQGDIFDHDYVITDGTYDVVSIHKKWISWGDTYELDIMPGFDPVTALAVVLAIDAVMEAQAAAAASSSSSDS